MAKQAFYPRGEQEQVAWLENYALKFNDHATTLGMGTEVTATTNDCAFLAWVLGTWHPALQNDLKEATAYKRTIATGSGGSVISPPAGTTFGTIPTAVTPGVLTRIFNQVARAKAAAGYTEAIGMDLGVIGADDSAEHPAPDFAVDILDTPGVQNVKLSFKKFGHEGVHIESRRGAFSSPWEFLTVDTHSPYVDNRALLTALTPEVREYRMLFWDGGVTSGSYSAVKKGTVS